MLIDRIFPAVIADKSTVRELLFAEAINSGLTSEFTESLIDSVPVPLINAEAFLDRLTGLWRYEFGVPYNLTDSLYWGTHMWVPVEHLFVALHCASYRLPEEKRSDYLIRLSDPERHHAILVEMIPAQKVDPAIPLDFEVAGFGNGNRTVDWVIRADDGRIVMLDVKRRTTDFIAQVKQMAEDSSAQEPIHDSALLFRSVETKFLPADPNVKLQGAWICTDIMQNGENLSLAFSAMCSSKVHFAILGDWKDDVHILVRRSEDKQYLLDLFRATPSVRFTF